MSPPVSVRLATTSDELAAAGDVVATAYRADGFADERYLGDASTRALVADLLVAVDEGGTVLGSVTYARAGTPYAEVSRAGEAEFRMLGVSPGARGQGVGGALVDACIERARGEGSTALAICTMGRMTAAQSIYGRLGFVRDPERDWQPTPDIALLCFVLDLREAEREV